MADEADMAADYQARHNRDAIARTRGEAATGPGSEFCDWCEAEIPEARRQALPGCTLCVDCQAVKERLAGGM